MTEKYKFFREASKITLDKVSSWEELNAATIEEADEKFKEKTKETWNEFAVSGVLQFDKKEGKQVLKPFTDLDGKCALGFLKEAGINTDNLTYVKPGEYLKGAINLDTGDKFGVVYEEPTYTAYFDHHTSGAKEVTSTAEIVYKTLVDLKLLERSESMDRLVDFVTKIDNRKFPPEEFLKSAKTILGLQRDLDFKKLLAYFKDRESPTEELTPEEFQKYGLRESAKKQQETVDEAMETLEQMEKEGWVLDTKYGKVLMNFNNRLKVGASAAYVKYDGIVNYGGNGFAITLKNKNLEDLNLPQGKLIRNQMWIYNEKPPLEVTPAEILRALGTSLEKKEGELIEMTSYNLKDLHPPYRLFRPDNTTYYIHIDYPDPAITGIKEKTSAQNILSSKKRLIEASLYAADDFIQRGSLEALKQYFDSWKEIKSPKDMTFHEIKWRNVPASDGWGYTDEMYVFPDFYEYLAFSDDKDFEEIKNELKERTFQMWLKKKEKSFRRASKKYPYSVWVGDLRIDGANNRQWIASKRIRDKNGWVDHNEQDLKEPVTFDDFEKLCREILF
jgi:hypothetical protein